MKWPISAAPYDIAIIPMINKNDTSALDKANKISLELNQNNIDTIIDDSDENLSSKIKKMNLIGAPYQIIIGKQTEGDLFEFKEISYGATDNGHFMISFFSSYFASIMAPTNLDTPIP